MPPSTELERERQRVIDQLEEADYDHRRHEREEDRGDDVHVHHAATLSLITYSESNASNTSGAWLLLAPNRALIASTTGVPSARRRISTSTGPMRPSPRAASRANAAMSAASVRR